MRENNNYTSGNMATSIETNAHMHANIFDLYVGAIDSTAPARGLNDH